MNRSIFLQPATGTDAGSPIRKTGSVAVQAMQSVYISRSSSRILS
jgi:hypothetical protein